MPPDLKNFVKESNRIEGIHREPSVEEMLAHENFIKDFRSPTILRLEQFVEEIAPGKLLRRAPGMDVRVGDHLPPLGGPKVEENLQLLLVGAKVAEHPFKVHCAYETLHPFMDGNGRSGRVLWLWQMLVQRRDYRALNLGFLHMFYYQSLQFSEDRK